MGSPKQKGSDAYSTGASVCHLMANRSAASRTGQDELDLCHGDAVGHAALQVACRIHGRRIARRAVATVCFTVTDVFISHSAPRLPSQKRRRPAR